jgi:hypothetical protein
VFGTILERFAADLEKQHMDVDERLDGCIETVGKPLEFDYSAIAKLLHETSASVPAKRRKRIEKLAQR